MPHGDQLYSEKSSSSYLEEELLGLVLFLKNISDWSRRVQQSMSKGALAIQTLRGIVQLFMSE
jgi:hypothetical protein